LYLLPPLSAFFNLNQLKAAWERRLAALSKAVLLHKYANCLEPGSLLWIFLPLRLLLLPFSSPKSDLLHWL